MQASSNSVEFRLLILWTPDEHWGPKKGSKFKKGSKLKIEIYKENV